MRDDHFFEWTRGMRSHGSPVTERDVDLAGDVRLCQVMLYFLVRTIAARRILELGTADGSTTLALLHGAAVTKGNVISIDPCPCEDAKRLVASCEYGDRWLFCQTTSDEYFELHAAENAAPFDLVFIDANHHCDFVERDMLHALQYTVEGGVIVSHDWGSGTPDIESKVARSEVYGASRGVRAAVAKYDGPLYAIPFMPETLRYAHNREPVENGSEGGFILMQKPLLPQNKAGSLDCQYFQDVFAPKWARKLRDT